LKRLFEMAKEPAPQRSAGEGCGWSVGPGQLQRSPGQRLPQPAVLEPERLSCDPSRRGMRTADLMVHKVVTEHLK
jgi:hypothetical protein